MSINNDITDIMLADDTTLFNASKKLVAYAEKVRADALEEGRQNGLDEAIVAATSGDADIDHWYAEEIRARKAQLPAPDFCQYTVPHGRIGDWSRCERVPEPGSEYCSRHAEDGRDGS